MDGWVKAMEGELYLFILREEGRERRRRRKKEMKTVSVERTCNYFEENEYLVGAMCTEEEQEAKRHEHCMIAIISIWKEKKGSDKKLKVVEGL